jgi:hypothetical protein
MYFDGENESFNAEFRTKNITVSGMLISIQNYKVFSNIPFKCAFPLNQPYLLNFL